MQSFDYLFDLNIVYFHFRILLLLELPYFYCILIAHKNFTKSKPWQRRFGNYVG